MKISFVRFALIIYSICMASTVYADRCTADAEFDNFWKTGNNKFKFKFIIESEDCVQYSCRGYINYTIHFTNAEGESRTETTLTSYSIKEDSSIAEEVHEHYVSEPTYDPVGIDDVEITEVSCSTP
jgi:hypothetical protein